MAGGSRVYGSGVIERSPAPAVEARAIAGYGAATAALAVFVCRVLIAAAIVPPWQGPDEPAHFAQAKRLAQRESSQAGIVEIERETLQSMARHGWWQSYQERVPDPLPYAFSQVPEHLNSGISEQPVYYVLASAVLRTVDDSDIDRQYFALRLLSIGLAIATLLCGWLGTKRFFGAATASGALALVSLHPQFLLTAISVNPDVLIDLCGALVWWQVARLCDVTARARVGAVALIAAASLVAVFSKRNGIPLPLVSVLAASVALRGTGRRLPLTAVTASIVFALGFVAVAYVAGHYSESAGRLLTFWRSVFVVRRSIGGTTPSEVLQFAAAANDTAWLYAGWLRFPPPPLWSWVARMLTVTGLAAAAWLTMRNAPNNRPFLIAWMFAGLYTAALFGVAFMAVSAPQGRYVFAVLFPFAALLWRGLVYCFRPVLKSYAPAAIVGIVAVMDACGFLFVLLPAYIYTSGGTAF